MHWLIVAVLLRRMDDHDCRCVVCTCRCTKVNKVITRRVCIILEFLYSMKG